jgi:DeoR/GlpR family transcriptional regulator of sugar metabolism
MLKEERHRRILELLDTEGRLVAAELPGILGVSGHTIRRDLDELATARSLQRVHGGALARSPVPATYEERQVQAVEGKIATARAAATLLEPGQVVILDGGSTGTFVTHSPPVAAALARHPGLEIVTVGGTLDARAMVAVGARAIETFRGISADLCFLGVWALHAEGGISTAYYEEAELRRVLVECADRVVGLVSREKLGTAAAFTIAPATALTHLATEPDVPEALLRPFADLGLHILQ